MILPLDGVVLVPCEAAVASRELAVVTPEYSRTAKRNVPEMVSDTVTVLVPPRMFSA